MLGWRRRPDWAGATIGHWQHWPRKWPLPRVLPVVAGGRLVVNHLPSGVCMSETAPRGCFLPTRFWTPVPSFHLRASIPFVALAALWQLCGSPPWATLSRHAPSGHIVVTLYRVLLSLTSPCGIDHIGLSSSAAVSYYLSSSSHSGLCCKTTLSRYLITLGWHFVEAEVVNSNL